jgi:SAM-dependent methyltransferase
MVASVVYDALYRWWAPWDSVGVRADLRALLDFDTVTPTTHPRAIDLGCGTGANVVHLAEQGFEAWGVDFSPVAVRKAEARAVAANVGAQFVVGDLTATEIPGVEGTFDLLVDFGTLDDLRGAARIAMRDTVDRLSHPGSAFMCFCFFGPTDDLPRISFTGPSRMSGTIAPGEMESLFGHAWEIETFNPYKGEPYATFLLTRRAGRA